MITVLFVPVMRTKRNNGNIDLGVVDFINHTILLVDAARPSLFIRKMFEMLHLAGSCAGMLLKLNQKVDHLLYRGLVSTLLYGGKFRFCPLGKKYSVCHLLKSVYQLNNIFLRLKSSKLGIWLMGSVNILLHCFYVTGIGKEKVARRTNLVWICQKRWFQQLAGQPLPVALRE